MSDKVAEIPEEAENDANGAAKQTIRSIVAIPKKNDFSSDKYQDFW